MPRTYGWPDRPAGHDPQVSAPSACEACGSSAVSTGSKTIDATTYFNCGVCGHVWNPGRSRGRADRQHDWR